MQEHKTWTENKLYPVSELQLGDTIQFELEAWSTAIVTQITEDEIHYFRPYGHTADFSYTGGVIPYIGIENGKLSKYSKHPVKVIYRQQLR